MKRSTPPATPSPIGLATYWYEALPLHATHTELAKTATRARQRGTLQAANERLARLALRQQQLVPTQLKLLPAQGTVETTEPFWEHVNAVVFRQAHRQAMVDGLTQLVSQQELPLLDALAVLEKDAPTQAWQQGLLHLRQQLLNGHALEDALNQQAELWGLTTATCLVAGQAQGHLSETLDALSHTTQQRHIAQHATRYAKITATGLLFLALGLTALLWWVPAHTTQPSAWQAFWYASHQAGWTVVMTALGLLWVGCLTYQWWRHSITAALLRWAPTRHLWQWYQASQWLGHWQIALQMHLSTLDSLRLTAGLATSPRIKAMLGHCLCRIEEGEPFHVALDALPLAPIPVARALSHLAGTDQLPTVVAQLFQESVRRGTQGWLMVWAIVHVIAIAWLLALIPLWLPLI